MRKKFIFNEIMSALVLLLLASCSGSGWKLEGNLKGLQGGHLRLVWVDASGSVSEQRVVAEGDRFKAAGECAGMTLIAVYTGETRLLTLLAAEPGDKLELKGEVSRPYSLEVSGNEACEQWLRELEHMKKTGRVPQSVGSWLLTVLGSILGGSAVGGISLGKAKLGMRAPRLQTNADAYLVAGTMQIRNAGDTLINTTTSRRYAPITRSSSGGGGGSSYSSSFSGSSGSSHSGSGRSF